MEYQHILAATDFSASGLEVGKRARQLAISLNASLTIINVVEYSFINLGGDLALPPQIDIEAQLLENAKQQLAKYVADLDIAQCRQMVTSGVPKSEIIKVAEKEHIDLILVGSHGRHGLARLLGSTANAVIHSAKCDVLAVRTPESN